MRNPALRQYPRQQNAPVIPSQHDASILDWLESSGRMLHRQQEEQEFSDDEVEINELMSGDDSSFDDDDDDSLDLDD